MPSVATNWDGTAPKTDKPLIPENVYDGTITKIRHLEAKSFDGTGMENRVVLDFTIPEVEWTKTNEDGTTEKMNGCTISLWVNPTITKGSGRFSNSTLYNIIEKAGLLDKAKENTAKFADETNGLDNLVGFLSENLEGKKSRFTVLTRNKGKENQYTSVKEVVTFS